MTFTYEKKTFQVGGNRSKEFDTNYDLIFRKKEDKPKDEDKPTTSGDTRD